MVSSPTRSYLVLLATAAIALGTVNCAPGHVAPAQTRGGNPATTAGDSTNGGGGVTGGDPSAAGDSAGGGDTFAGGDSQGGGDSFSGGDSLGGDPGPAPDTTPPTVTTTTPSSGDVNVDPTASVEITFSEALDPTTVTAANFLIDGATVAVSWDAATDTATLTPQSALPTNAVITARVETGVTDLAGNALASEYVFTFHTKDPNPPSVVSTTPADGATGVSSTTALVIHFSEPINSLTVTSNNFICDGLSTLVTWDGTSYANNATIRPSAGQWPDGATVTCRVETGVTDLDGNALAAEYVLSFTTQDTVPPTVASTSPADGATAVDATTTVQVTFDEAMDPTTITSTSVLLDGITASVTYDAATKTAVLTPAAPLPASTLITGRVETTVTDLAGNALATEYVFSFTTAAADVPPTVTTTTPSSGDVNVDPAASVEITFSKALDPTTVTATNFLIDGVTVSVSWDGTINTATLTPQTPLPTNSVITARVETGVTDVAGTALASEYVFSFHTKDPNPPSVVSTTPADGATGVSGTTSLVIHFNEPLNTSTVTSNNFLCDGLSTLVTWNGTNYANNATIRPSAGQWPDGATVTCRVETGVEDLDGNSMAAEYVLSFAIIDTVPPTVVSTNPANGATGVATSTTVQVTFDEAIDPSTLDSTSFTIIGQTGSVTYDAASHTATFTPSAPLAAGTLYTAQVTTAVTDTSGNALTANDTWTFTTAADTTPPTITASSPAPYAHFVADGSSLTTTFSEDVDPTTITTSNITLTGPSGAVTGTVSYDPSTFTATFTPSSPLVDGVGYTLAVSGVKDLAGNTMSTTYSAPFRTPANVVQISGTTTSERGNMKVAVNGSNVMLLFTTANGGAAKVRWAYYTGGSWSANGELGTGSPTAVVPYGTGFAAHWYDGSAYQVDIFNSPGWNNFGGSPTGSGKIGAAGSDLVYVDPSNNYAVFNGSSWGALSTTPLSTNSYADFAANGSLALLVTSTYTGTSYAFYGLIYDGATHTWGAETQIATTTATGTFRGATAVASPSGFVVAGATSAQAALAVYDASSSSWSSTTVTPANGNAMGSRVLATNGTGYCFAWFDTAYALHATVYQGGAWDAGTTSSNWFITSFVGIASDGTGYEVVGYKSSYTGLGAWRYDGSSWSLDTLSIASNPTSVALSGATGAYSLSWLAAGQVSASLYTTAWGAAQPIDTSGTADGLAVAGVGSTLMEAVADGAISTSNSNASGGFDAPVVVPDPGVASAATGSQIAVAADGSAVAIWEQSQRGQTALFMRPFDGSTWGSIQTVQSSLASSITSPAIATDGTDWVMTWIDVNPAGTRTVKAAQWTTAGGLTTPVSVSSTYTNTSYVVSSAPVASTGSDFLVVWSNNGYVLSSYSATGSTFSSPTTVDSTSSNLEYPHLAANASGYIVSYQGLSTSYTTARIETRPAGASGVWSTYALMSEASCKVYAADTVYAATCGTTNAYLSTDGLAWSSGTAVGYSSTMFGVAPANGGRFRIVVGTTVYNSTGTTFDSNTDTVSGLLAPIALGSDNETWFLLGGATNAGYNGIEVYDTSGTGFQDRGLLETNPGNTYTPAMGGAHGIVGAVWSQDTGATSTPAVWGSLF